MNRILLLMLITGFIWGTVYSKGNISLGFYSVTCKKYEKDKTEKFLAIINSYVNQKLPTEGYSSENWRSLGMSSLTSKSVEIDNLTITKIDKDFGDITLRYASYLGTDEKNYHIDFVVPVKSFDGIEIDDEVKFKGNIDGFNVVENVFLVDFWCGEINKS